MFVIISVANCLILSITSPTFDAIPVAKLVIVPIPNSLNLDESDPLIPSRFMNVSSIAVARLVIASFTRS